LRDDLKALSNSGSKGTVSSGEPIAGSLLTDLRALFRENGWPFSDVRGAPVLFSELSGTLGRWKFYAQVVEEQDLILLYSVCPFRVPEERRAEVSEFLTRANYGLAAGNFELDFADGEVRYKTALQRHVDGLDAATLKRAVRANGIAMETYLPGVGAVITGTAPVPELERLFAGSRRTRAVRSRRPLHASAPLRLRCARSPLGCSLLRRVLVLRYFVRALLRFNIRRGGHDFRSGFLRVGHGTLLICPWPIAQDPNWFHNRTLPPAHR
jgi:hypothetical protein